MSRRFLSRKAMAVAFGSISLVTFPSKDSKPRSVAWQEAKNRARILRRYNDSRVHYGPADNYGKTSVTEDKVRELPIVSYHYQHVHHLDAAVPGPVTSVAMHGPVDTLPVNIKDLLADKLCTSALAQVEHQIAIKDRYLKDAAESDFKPFQDLSPADPVARFRVGTDPAGLMAKDVLESTTFVYPESWIKATSAKLKLLPESEAILRKQAKATIQVDVLSDGGDTVSGFSPRTRVVGGYEDADDVKVALASRSNSSVIAIPSAAPTITARDPAVWSIVAHKINRDVADALAAKKLDFKNPHTQAFQVEVGKTLGKTQTSASAEYVAEQVMGALYPH